MPRFALASLCLALVLIFAGAAPAAAGHASGPNPDAPEGTGDFAFLIGTWETANKWLLPDGESWHEDSATWTGYWILDGWAIQDDWVQPLGEGQVFHGTNIRSVDPATGKWIARWLPIGKLAWGSYSAEKVGDTMVMTGGEGEDARGAYVDRITFYDIEADSWRWKRERSHDGGKTWVTDAHIVAKRKAG